MQELFPKSHFPTSSELDITTDVQVWTQITGLKEIDTIVHMAAYTSPPKVDNNPIDALAVNIIGTCYIVEACAAVNKRLIYISTDYVFDGNKGNYKEDDPMYPVNKYAWSKLGGECAVKMYDNSLIVRLSFGPNEFPYEGAFIDQWTSREPVSAIAKKLKKLIISDVTGTIHIGSNRRTVYNYAKSISPDKKLLELSIKNMQTKMPKDTSLDITRYKSIIGDEKSET